MRHMCLQLLVCLLLVKLFYEFRYDFLSLWWSEFKGKVDYAALLMYARHVMVRRHNCVYNCTSLRRGYNLQN